MKTKVKKQKGITLIALVVTIVVLILLAGVTVNLLIGDEGIIARAQSADDIQAGAVEEDKEALAQLGSKIDEYTGEKVEEGTILAAYINGELVQGDCLEYTPTGATSYDPDQGTVGSLTGYSTAQSIARDSLNWRILGKDGNNILLISDVPTTSKMIFTGDVGFTNFVDVMHDTCNALYKNDELGVTARSMNAEDCEKYLNATVTRETITPDMNYSWDYTFESVSSVSMPNESFNFLYSGNFMLANKSRFWLASPEVVSYGVGGYYLAGVLRTEFCMGEILSSVARSVQFRPIIVVPGNTMLDEIPLDDTYVPPTMIC